MLDLIEYLARWVRGPVLIVCLARDELLERRPGWGGGPPERHHDRPGAARRRADARARRARCSTATERGDGEDLDRQVASRSGGNPLFAEEMVNRIREEGAGSEALPETVHAVLAARLDALPALERRVLQARVGRRREVLGGLARRARRRGGGSTSRETLNSARGEGPHRPDAPGSRLAGEREYAFKHVLIRDVAYCTLPKAARARKHAEVGGFIEERAADRSEGVVAMVAEHYGRAAALGEDADLEPERARRSSRPRDRGARGGGRRRRRDVLEPRGDRPLRDGARRCERELDPEAAARIGEKLGDVALRLGRVDHADRAAGSECLDYHRGEEDLARVGDLHRKIGAGAVAQGRARGLDRALPARHRPAEGRPAVPGARRALRGGGLALHAHRRQHARDLRVREGAAPGRAPRRGRGREPRVRDLRAGVRPHRRLRARAARTSSARSSSPASSTRARRSARCCALGYYLEVFEADYDGAAERLPRGARDLAERRATCRPRSSCTRTSPRSPPTAAAGRTPSARPRRPSSSPSARASIGKLCFPT